MHFIAMLALWASTLAKSESCENLEKGRKSYAKVKGTRSETREVGIDDDANYEAYMNVMYTQWECRSLDMTAGIAIDNRGR